MILLIEPLFIYLPPDANDAFPCHQPINLSHGGGALDGLRPPNHHCFRHAKPA